ncbi:MAG: hypothetical protein IJ733_01610 [Lachnospiraceae bacterium]|nr:hypothetical protein [Lachnospiraceae bacterium]
MKKFFKVLVGVGAIVGGAAGVFYLLNKKNDDNFKDFDDDDFEDIFAEDDDEDRDYVTLDIDGGEKADKSDGSTEEKTETSGENTTSEAEAGAES